MMRNRQHQPPFNELNEGKTNKLPTSVIRSVSFQKLRDGKFTSQSQRINQNIKGPSQMSHQQSNKSNVYERIIKQKLNGNKQNEKQYDIKKNNSRRMSSKPIAQKIRDQNLVLSEKEKEELRECTFKPQINNPSSNKRTLNEFIDQQLQFEKNKEDKVQQMRQIIKQNLERENTFHPNLKLNLGSTNMRNYGTKQPVHNRLYQYSKEKQQKLNEAVQAQLDKVLQDANRSGRVMGSRTSSKLSLKQLDKRSSEPQIQQQNQSSSILNIIRKTEKSFQRPERRRSKGVSLSRNSRDLNLQSEISAATKKRNQEMCINKIFRQIAKILTNLQIAESKLTYIQMSEILSQMKFISNKSKQQESTLDARKYLYDIWQMLQGDTNGHVSLISLLKIIYAIIGCHDTQLVSQILQNRIEIGKEVILQNLILTEKDSKAIKAKFQSFYTNRLKQGDKQLSQIYDTHTFRPQISKISSEMAEKYRQRVIGQSQKLIDDNLIQFNVPQNGQITHIDLLMLDQKRKELRLKLQRQQLEILKRMEQDEIMGLRRKNNNLQQNTIPYTSRDSNHSRFNQLFEHSKSNHRRDKSKDEVQAERWSQQLTFKPQTSTPYYKIQSTKLSIDVPDFDKAVFRMYQGRRIKQQGQYFQKGQISDKIEGNSEYENKNPILYLNVCMQGNQNVKVPVFKSDNLGTITSKVKMMLRLDTKTTNQELQELLRMQIEPVLKKIAHNLHHS